MSAARLDLTREQILANRRRVGALEERLPWGAVSLRRASHAGHQDSMPRAALLSIHARVAHARPDAWEDPALIQLWGPRFSAYVIAAEDRAVFTLGRLPDGAKATYAGELADRLEAFLDGRRMTPREAGRGLGVHPNHLRYAAPTGRVVIRWDGARQPTIWMLPAPDVEPMDARLELARRYLRVLGPGTPTGFADWAGIKPARARVAFERLAGSLTPVRTPIGDAWILADDEPVFREATTTAAAPAAVRLLPSGDPYYLLQGTDRELLVPDARHRPLLWTPRVWPGAILVDGEIVGTWRRASAQVTLVPWVRLSAPTKERVVAEAESLPIPDVQDRILARWAEG
jgi:winged helix DNA-binding protein